MKRTRRFSIGSGRNLKVLLLGAGGARSDRPRAGTRYTRTGCSHARPEHGRHALLVRGTAEAAQEHRRSSASTPTFQDVKKQWPFPRAVRRQGAQQHRGTAPGGDRVRHRVLATQLDQREGRRRTAMTRALGNRQRPRRALVPGDQRQGRRAAVRAGPDPEGAARRRCPAGEHPVPIRSRRLYPPNVYSIDKLTTFAIVTAETATGKKITSVQRQQAGSTTAGRRAPSTNISYGNVYTGPDPPANLLPRQDRGDRPDRALAPGPPPDVDRPADGREPRSQANAIDTVLRGFPLSLAPGWVDVVLIVLFGVTVPLAALRVRPDPLDRDRGRARGRVRGRGPAPVQRRHDRVVRLSAAAR